MLNLNDLFWIFKHNQFSIFYCWHCLKFKHCNGGHCVLTPNLSTRLKAKEFDRRVQKKMDALKKLKKWKGKSAFELLKYARLAIEEELDDAE